MKNLKSKIFTGIFLAGLTFGTGNKIKGQDADSLEIEIDTLNANQITQMINSVGYYNDEQVAFIGCSLYKDNHYTKRDIRWEISKNIREEFEIDYNAGLINYKMYLLNPYKVIVDFKNLTKEQIYQDKEFAERTKRIINACESEDKLREMIKEIYKEHGAIKIPKIRQ